MPKLPFLSDMPHYLSCRPRQAKVSVMATDYRQELAFAQFRLVISMRASHYCICPARTPKDFAQFLAQPRVRSPASQASVDHRSNSQYGRNCRWNTRRKNGRKDAASRNKISIAPKRSHHCLTKSVTWQSHSRPQLWQWSNRMVEFLEGMLVAYAPSLLVVGILVWRAPLLDSRV